MVAMRLIALALFICIPASAQGNVTDRVRPPICACTGQIPTYPAGTEPLCDAATRSSVIITLGGTGQPDLVLTCARDGAGRYAWVGVGQQNTNTFVNSRNVGGCPLFPDDNVWNSRADSLLVDPGSDAIISTFAANRLGTAPSMAINLATSSTPAFHVSFGGNPQSDGGSYPITGGMQMEGYGFNASFPVSGGPYNGDAHLLVIQTDQCKLYEIYALGSATSPYIGGSGAIFDLMANDLRPDGWTSSDAAGLPIWPGILRYGEVYGSGEIQHMIRFTVNSTRDTYIWPARHYASHNDSASVPPMGSRWRLKATFNEATCAADEHVGGTFPPEVQRIIRALKRYGMILADNGLPILITTDSDPRWGDPNSSSSQNWIFNGWTHCIRGSDFEVVDTSTMMANPNSSAVAK